MKRALWYIIPTCRQYRPIKINWNVIFLGTTFVRPSRNTKKLGKTKVNKKYTYLFTSQKSPTICNLCFISIRNQPHVALHYWPRRILKSQCWGFNFLTFCQNQTLQLLRCVYLALDWNFITFMFPSGSLKMQLELFRVPIFCYRKVFNQHIERNSDIWIPDADILLFFDTLPSIWRVVCQHTRT